MATELVMPKLGLTMTEGLVVNLLKAEGDFVKKGDGVLEIETEKLVNIVEAPTDGTLLRYYCDVGDSLPITSVLAYIGDPEETVPEAVFERGAAEVEAEIEIEIESSAAVAVNAHERVFASPAARALAKALGVDYTRLNGSGPGGRIVKKDVEAAHADVGVSAIESVSAHTGISYSGMRKAIGTRMCKSWQEAPMVTHHVRADVTDLLALRSELNKETSEDSPKIGVLELFVKIVARSIKQFPILNAALCENEIKMQGSINIGIAIAVENGLVVPVIKDAGEKSLFTISRELKALVAKAKGGSLTPDEMTGGTFTISNLGGYGSVDFFTPILNPPESAILGICRTQEEPVCLNGEIVARSMTGLSLTFDHRVIDGAPAAEFLAVLLKHLKGPVRALFEDQV